MVLWYSLHSGVLIVKFRRAANVSWFDINLGSAIKAGDSHKLKVSFWLTHVLTPLPAVVEQNEQQHVLFQGSVHMLSPYPSQKSVTEVKLASRKVLDYTETDALEPISQSGNKLTYGPYSEVPANSFEALSVHSANSAPFVTFTNVEREIEVSLWGNVAVEEFFTLKHTGAVLRDGLFSRIDYMKGQVGNSYRKLTGTLPAGARDVYYRDIIGNISTSNLREGLQSSQLDIETRFPMFGGWNTEWYQGYNLPTEQVLTQTQNTFHLDLPLAITYADSVTDEYVVKVVLPEGASNIQVQPVEGMTKVDHFARFTYLDAVQGRPVLEFKASNLIKAHTGHLVLQFDMPPMALLREPAMLIGTFLSMFLVGSLVSRVRLAVDSRQ